MTKNDIDTLRTKGRQQGELEALEEAIINHARSISSWVPNLRANHSETPDALLTISRHCDDIALIYREYQTLRTQVDAPKKTSQ